jgi:chorismate mutase
MMRLLLEVQLRLSGPLAVGTVLVGLAATGAPGADDGADCVPRLMAERLSLMPAVAHYKWSHDLPIEDPKREAEILDGLAARDDLGGLGPAFLRAFFRAQIEAAKDIQRRRFDEFAADPPPADGAFDLETQLRPVLDRLTTELIACLAEWLEPLRQGNLAEQLEIIPQAMVDDLPAWQIAVAPLVALQPSP